MLDGGIRKHPLQWIITSDVAVRVNYAEDRALRYIHQSGPNRSTPPPEMLARLYARQLSNMKTARTKEWIATCKDDPIGARRELMRDYRSSANDILFCVESSRLDVAGGIGARIMPGGVAFLDGARTDDWITRSVIERDGEVKALCQHYASRQFAIGTLDIDDNGRGNLIVEDYPSGEVLLALQRISQMLHAPEGLKWTGDRVNDWHTVHPTLDAALRLTHRTSEVLSSNLADDTKTALTNAFELDARNQVDHAAEVRNAISSAPQHVGQHGQEVPASQDSLTLNGPDGKQYLATQLRTEHGVHYSFSAIGPGGQLEPVFDRVSQAMLTITTEHLLPSIQPSGTAAAPERQPFEDPGPGAG